jgi:hypothetical protein
MFVLLDPDPDPADPDSKQCFIEKRMRKNLRKWEGKDEIY